MKPAPTAMATAVSGLRRTAAATSSSAALAVSCMFSSWWPPSRFDVAGQALQVGAKPGQIRGDLIHIVAQPLAGGHFGVIGRHIFLPFC